MSFDLLRQQFDREHIWVVEIVVDGSTYRFCENRTPIPVGLDAIPSLESVTIAPTAVDLSGGLGVRASCNIGFSDHLDYTFFGSATDPVRFWPRWRAEHPYYQGAEIKLLSAYIVDGVYSAANAQARQYVLETWGYSKGACSVTGKDPLKLADNKRAQAPRATTVTLDATASAAATTLTVNSTLDFTAGDYVRIGEEVILIDSVDSGVGLTVTREQYNTAAADHAIDDAVQLCLRYNDTLAAILYDLLTTYADVDPSFIPLTRWTDEFNLWLPGLYDTLITEPVGVQDLIKELAQQAPHYLYWDERTNSIEAVAIKQPPDDSQCLTDEENLIAGSVMVKDQNDMRVSRVIVHFGQFDPTKKLDEFSNYRQTYVRVDTDSEANYGSSRLKTIYSRWINNSNKAAAVRLAARIGRRFATAPRVINFALDSKDGNVWTGTACKIDTADIVDDTGARYCMPVQVLSAVEKEVYQYTALEHTYGPATPEDEEVDQPGKVVILSGELLNVNLRTVFDSLFPSVLADDEVIFIIDSSCVIGSASTSEGLQTGSWPELTTPPLVDVRGFVVGIGGTGANGLGTPTVGGLAMRLQNNIRLSNSGVIGGGGGGGAYNESTEIGLAIAPGGGGAGYLPGNAGTGLVNETTDSTTIYADAGSLEAGGRGARSGRTNGAAGGNLGQPGGNTTTQSGAAAGAAIDRDGYTITYTGSGAGDIRGAIL